MESAATTNVPKVSTAGSYEEDKMCEKCRPKFANLITAVMDDRMYVARLRRGLVQAALRLETMFERLAEEKRGVEKMKLTVDGMRVELADQEEQLDEKRRKMRERESALGLIEMQGFISATNWKPYDSEPPSTDDDDEDDDDDESLCTDDDDDDLPEKTPGLSAGLYRPRIALLSLFLLLSTGIIYIKYANYD